MPILFSGKCPASIEYGIESIDAQAMPTMLMATYKIEASLMYFTQNKPSPPISKQKVWVIFLPSLATQNERVSENKKVTKLSTDEVALACSMPCVYNSFEVIGSPLKISLATPVV